MENVKEPSYVNLCLQVTAVPLDSYCNDRSAEYERRVLKEGGSLAAKQCLLNGAPELAADWLNRRSQFFPEPAGGLCPREMVSGLCDKRLEDGVVCRFKEVSSSKLHKLMSRALRDQQTVVPRRCAASSVHRRVNEVP